MSRALLCVALALLAACGSLREARMAVPESLRTTPEESFGKPGWGRSGQFALGAMPVRYERGADRLSLFDTFRAGKAPLRIALEGGRQAECLARQSELSVGLLSGAPQPWTLSCHWQGGNAPEGRLQISEGRVQGAVQVREGQYRRAEVELRLRSLHRFEGSPLTQQAAVGYELLQGGRVVGSVDLSRGVPVLRRPDPATPLGQAVTEAALALALVWEPS